MPRLLSTHPCPSPYFVQQARGVRVQRSKEGRRDGSLLLLGLLLLPLLGVVERGCNKVNQILPFCFGFVEKSLGLQLTMNQTRK